MTNVFTVEEREAIKQYIYTLLEENSLDDLDDLSILAMYYQTEESEISKQEMNEVSDMMAEIRKELEDSDKGSITPLRDFLYELLALIPLALVLYALWSGKLYSALKAGIDAYVPDVLIPSWILWTFAALILLLTLRLRILESRAKYK